MRVPLTLLCLLFGACSSQAQPAPAIMDSGGPLMPEQAAYDVTFYRLNLALDPAERALQGEATIHATMVQPQDFLVLDLDTVFTVRHVVTDTGSPLSFHRRGGKLWVYLGETIAPQTPVVVTVAYDGKPRVAQRAPWDGGFVWAETPDGQPWIATAVQGEGADLWWPCKDHPSDEPDSLALQVTVPRGLVVAANGKLRERVELGETVRYDWFVSTPINNYGVAINVAPYRELAGTFTSVTGENVPMFLWVLPSRYEDGKWLFEEMKAHLNFYERVLGPYPWRADKYGVAHTPHLGMEHQTIIAYGSDFDAEPDGFDWLHHHELGHEWWGNLVTAWDWRDFWIHEGFCSYMQALYAEELHGAAGYHEQMRRKRGTIRNVKPLAPRASQTTDQMYFIDANRGVSNSDIYNKGAWVLHTLRFAIGDSLFAQSLRRFAYPTPEMERVTDGSQARFVSTDDYLVLVNALTGRDLSWFFEVYMRQPELPRLVTEREESTLRLRWEVPGNLPFPMPIAIAVDGVVQRVEMQEGQAVVALPTPTATVIVDPENWVLQDK